MYINVRPLKLAKSDIDGDLVFLPSSVHNITKTCIMNSHLFGVLHLYFTWIKTSCTSPLYLHHNKFAITTLFGSQQFLHRHFIWIRTSFRSQFYLDHNKFYITTLFGSYQVLHHHFTWIKTSSALPYLLHLLTPMVIWCSILLSVAKLQMHTS